MSLRRRYPGAILQAGDCPDYHFMLYLQQKTCCITAFIAATRRIDVSPPAQMTMIRLGRSHEPEGLGEWALVYPSESLKAMDCFRKSNQRRESGTSDAQAFNIAATRRSRTVAFIAEEPRHPCRERPSCAPVVDRPGPQYSKEGK